MSKTLAQTAAKQAVSTPKSIDLVAVAEQTAARKAQVGITFTDKRGKQSLFSGVCAQYKSLLGREKDSQLDDGEVGEVNRAIASFWTREANKVLGYGAVVSATYDKPSLKLDAEGRCGIKLNATLRAQRLPKDIAEYRLNAGHLLRKANERKAHMDANASKFDRDQWAEIAHRIMCLETAQGLKELPLEVQSL